MRGVIAKRYRDGRRLLKELCAARQVGIDDIQRRGRAAHIVSIKREFCGIAKLHGLGSVVTGALIHLDGSTVRYHRSASVRAGKKAWRDKNGRGGKRGTLEAAHGGDQGAGGGG